METISFVFLPEPNICRGSDFQTLRTLNVQHNADTDYIDEKFTLIAVNSYSKYSIIDYINKLSAKYLSMPGTEYNINAAIIMTICSEEISKTSPDYAPPSSIIKMIHDCGFLTPASDMLYVPIHNCDWNMYKEAIYNRMSPLK